MAQTTTKQIQYLLFILATGAELTRRLSAMPAGQSRSRLHDCHSASVTSGDRRQADAPARHDRRRQATGDREAAAAAAETEEREKRSRSGAAAGDTWMRETTRGGACLTSVSGSATREPTIAAPASLSSCLSVCSFVVSSRVSRHTRLPDRLIPEAEEDGAHECAG